MCRNRGLICVLMIILSESERESNWQKWRHFVLKLYSMVGSLVFRFSEDFGWVVQVKPQPELRKKQIDYHTHSPPPHRHTHTNNIIVHSR